MKKAEIHLRVFPFTLRGLVYLVDVFARGCTRAELFNEPGVGEGQQGGRTTGWSGDSLRIRGDWADQFASLLACYNEAMALEVLFCLEDNTALDMKI
jgi:hypothetical protein